MKSIIDHALALAPNSPEAHSALGLFFYWGHRQYEAALTEFNRTLELQPNNALAQQYCAAVRRRGEWERSLADLQRAQELDPRDAGNPENTERLICYCACGRMRSVLNRELSPSIRTTCRQRWIFSSLASTRPAISTRPGKLSMVFRRASSHSRANGMPQARRYRISGIRVYVDVIERRFNDAFQAFEKKMVSNDLAPSPATGRARCPSRSGRRALRQPNPLEKRRYRYSRPDLESGRMTRSR